MKLFISYKFQKKHTNSIRILLYITFELYKTCLHFISLKLFATYGSPNLSMYNDV